MICTTCQNDLPDDQFSWKIKNVRKHKICKECTKIRKKQHYETNKDVYLEKQIRINKAQRRKIQSLVDEYLKTHPCVDCGESDPVVLEFDHTDPLLKSFCVSRAHQIRVSESVLFSEIEKCEIRCANCHRRKHHRERKAPIG